MQDEVVTAVEAYYIVQEYFAENEIWVDVTVHLLKSDASHTFIEYCQQSNPECKFRLIEFTITKNIIISQ